MAKPTLAIITDAIRYDNHYPLKYFKQIGIKHFYHLAPYGDLTKEDLKDAIYWKNICACD